MIYPVVRAFLLADSEINAIIASRIWPLRLPQHPQLPALVVTQVSGQRAAILDGRAPLAHPRLQIDAWSQEAPGVSAFEQVHGLADLVRLRLEAYSGYMVDASTSPATRVRTWVHFDDEREFFEPDVNGGFWRVSSDFFVWHQTNQH